jgi:hypothetical protein
VRAIERRDELAQIAQPLEALAHAVLVLEVKFREALAIARDLAMQPRQAPLQRLGAFALAAVLAGRRLAQRERQQFQQHRLERRVAHRGVRAVQLAHGPGPVQPWRRAGLLQPGLHHLRDSLLVAHLAEPAKGCGQYLLLLHVEHFLVAGKTGELTQHGAQPAQAHARLVHVFGQHRAARDFPRVRQNLRQAVLDDGLQHGLRRHGPLQRRHAGLHDWPAGMTGRQLLAALGLGRHAQPQAVLLDPGTRDLAQQRR